MVLNAALSVHSASPRAWVNALGGRAHLVKGTVLIDDALGLWVGARRAWWHMCGQALGVRVSTVVRLTRAHRPVFDNAALGIDPTGTRAWVQALEVLAVEVLRAVRVDATLWAAPEQRVAKVAILAGAEGLTNGIDGADGVLSARQWIAGVDGRDLVGNTAGVGIADEAGLAGALLALLSLEAVCIGPTGARLTEGNDGLHRKCAPLVRCVERHVAWQALAEGHSSHICAHAVRATDDGAAQVKGGCKSITK